MEGDGQQTEQRTLMAVNGRELRWPSGRLVFAGQIAAGSYALFDYETMVVTWPEEPIECPENQLRCEMSSGQLRIQAIAYADWKSGRPPPPHSLVVLEQMRQAGLERKGRRGWEEGAQVVEGGLGRAEEGS